MDVLETLYKIASFLAETWRMLVAPRPATCLSRPSAQVTGRGRSRGRRNDGYLFFFIGTPKKKRNNNSRHCEKRAGVKIAASDEATSSITHHPSPVVLRVAYCVLRTAFCILLTAYCLLLAPSATASYLPVTGPNIGIGTTTPVGGLVIMNGNVGIGTWSPRELLELTSGRVLLGSTTAPGTTTNKLYSVAGSLFWNGIQLDTGAVASGWLDSGTTIYEADTTDVVGIGTTTPSTTLEIVKQGTNAPLMVSGVFNGDGDYLIVHSSGNVGVGTQAPGSKLTVSGGLAVGSAQAYTTLAAPTDGLVVQGNVGIGTTAAAGKLIIPSGNIGFGTLNPVAGLSVMTGNVGIGTWSPIGSLEVKGGSATRIWTGAGTDTNATSAGELYVEGDLEVDGTIYGDGSGIVGGTVTNAGGWTDGGTNVYQTTTTDLVGIGTTTPSTTLEIVKQGTNAPLMVSSVFNGDGDLVIVTSNGNVGIGTASPQRKLQINDSSPTTITSLAFYNPNTTDNVSGTVVSFRTDTTGAGASTFVETAGYEARNVLHDHATRSSDFSMFASSAGTFKYLTLKGSGNVGIGTANPLARLETVAAGAVPLMVSSTGGAGNLMIVASGGNVGIGTIAPVGGLTVMSGNVGIGTWSPIGQLEVRGGSGATRIWTGAGTDTNATLAGELYVEGDLEVDGTIYGDGSGITGGTVLNAGGWTDGGTNVYQTTTTDLVGIGTTTPSTTLEIVKQGTSAPLMISSVATSDGDFLIVNSAGRVGIGTTLASAITGLSVMNGNVGIGTWNPTGQLIVAGGNVGIGSLTPDYKLSVSDSQQNLFLLTQSGTTGSWRFRNGTVSATKFQPRLEGVEDSDGAGTDTFAFEMVGTVDADGSGASVYPAISFDGRNSGSALSIRPILGIGSFISTPSAYKFLIDANGNVGIGTTTPVGGLTVMSGNVGIGTWKPANASLGVIGNVAIGTTLPYRTLTAPQAGMFVEGNVGIGTFAPGRPLHISSSVAPTLIIERSNGTADQRKVYMASVGGASGDDLAFGMFNDALTASERMRITQSGNAGIGTTTPVGGLTVMSGNVGIGTWSPREKLEVNGRMLMSDSSAPGTTTNRMYAIGGNLFWNAIQLDTGAAVSGWTDGGTNVYTSTTTDNVGIGTTTPSTTMEIVKQSTNPLLMLSSVATGDGDFLMVSSDGNVGIGSINPEKTLIVHNSTPATGITQLRIRGGAGQSTTNEYFVIEDEAGFVRHKFLKGYAVISSLQLGSLGNSTISGNNDEGLINLQNAATEAFTLTSYTNTTNANVFLMNARPNSTAENLLQVQRAGTAKITVDNAGNFGIGTTTPVGALTVMNGNVGIGTWSPTTKLDVVGGGAFTATVFVPSVRVTSLQDYASGATNADIAFGGASKYITLSTNAIEAVRVISSGNVGIGTAAPVGALTVMNGNVGIGTWSPTSKLEIKGGDLRVGGGTFTNTSANDDAYVTGNLEVDGTIYGDGSGITGGTVLNAGGWTDGGTNVFTSLTTDLVGVGTTTPIALMEVEQAAAADAFRVNDAVKDDSPFLIDSAGNVGIGTTTVPEKFVMTSGNMGLGTLNPVAGLVVMTGRVGIGTWAPIAPLEVRGTTYIVGGNLNLDDGSGMVFGGNPYIRGDASGILKFVMNSNIEMQISPNNVGIGTVNPVGGTMIMNGNIGIGTWSTSGISGSLIVAAGVGNVGIGTIRPGTRLDVNGTVRATAFSGDGSLLTGIASAGGWTDGGTNVYTSTTTDVVGIGTTTPSATTTLEIVKQSSNAPLKISSAAAGAGDFFLVDSAGNIGIGTTKTTTAALSIMNGNVGIGTWKPAGALIVSGGNVGIATQLPGALLDVMANNNTTDFQAIRVVNHPTTQQSAGLGVDNTGSGFGAAIFQANVKRFVMEQNGSALVGTNYVNLDNASGNNTADGMIVEGNVGIGTHKLSNKLTVNGAVAIGASYVNIVAPTDGLAVSGNVGIGTAAAAGKLIIPSGNVGFGTLNPVGGLIVMTGNVGIGTWSPTSKLEIKGGDLRLGGGTFTNTSANEDAYVTGNLEVDGTIYGDGSGLTGSSSLTMAGGWTDGGTNVYTSLTTDNVGIGTTTPTGTLEIVKTAASTAPFMVSSVATSDGDSFIVNSAGSVGIGTTLMSPITGLSVMNGNVGIGTIDAPRKLTVRGDSTGVLTMVGLYNASTTNNNGIVYSFRTDTTGGGAATFVELAAIGARFVEHDNATSKANLYFMTANNAVAAEKMRLTYEGNLGIGTTSPADRLFVNGNIGVGTTAAFQTIAAPNNGLIVEGNVGIGTWAPDAQLEITKLGNQVSLMVSSVGSGNGDFLLVDSRGGVGIGTTKASAITGLTVMSGNVGIGTWSPATQLQIYGQNDTGLSTPGNFVSGLLNDANISIDDNEIMARINGAVSPLYLNYDGGAVVLNGSGDVSGNVGIGTLNPVGGTAIMSGNVGIGTWSTSGISGSLIVAAGVGNVGIGTIRPGTRLDVNGTVRATAFSGDGSLLTGIASGGGWTDGGTNVYTSLTTDNVGIGTTTPTSTLEVVKTAAGTAPLMISTTHTADGNLLIVNSASQVGIGTTLMSPITGLSVMNGNVGIGTWNPIAALDVKGGVRSKDISSYVNESTVQLVSLTNAGGDTAIQFFSSGNTRADIRRSTDDFRILTSSSSSAPGNINGLLMDNAGNVGLGTFPATGLSIMNGNVGIGTWSTSGISGSLIVAAGVGNVGIGTIRPGTRLDVNGTVRATAFSGDGSLLTGIASAGGWTDGGTNVYTSLTTDNVGIGTTTPTSTLEVVKTAAGTAPLMISTTATADGDYLLIDSSGGVGIGTTKTSPITGLSIMNGRVGIGTWNPLYILEVMGDAKFRGNSNAITLESVSGSTSGYIRVQSGVGLVSDANSGGAAYLYGSGGTGVNVDSAGEVGIGTTLQSAGLAVMNGNVGIGTWSVDGISGSLIVAAGVGNVGIGTIRPGTRLDVNGTVRATAFSGDGSLLTGIASAGGWTDGGTNVYTTLTTDNVGIGTTTPSTTLEIVKTSSRVPLMISSVFSGDGDYVIVTSNGNVGIGTTSPQQLLTVGAGGDASADASVAALFTNSGDTDIAVRDSLNNVELELWAGGLQDGSLGTSLGSLTNHIFQIITNDTVRLRISTAGNVGIGTLAAGSKLAVSGGVSVGSGSAYTSLAAPTDGLIVQGNVGIGTFVPGGSLEVITAASTIPFLVSSAATTNGDVFVVTSAGNVGVGTTGPDAKFVVGSGNVGIGTTLAFNGTSIMNGNVGIGTWKPEGILTVKQGNVGLGTFQPVGGLVVMTGNVGIGTWSPETTFTVNSNSSSGDVMRARSLNSTETWWVFTNTSSSNSPRIGGIGSDIVLKTGGVDRVWVQELGNVGIGTSLSSAGLAIMNGNVGIGTWKPEGILTVKQGNVGLGTFQPVAGLSVMTGNVGIGTWSPRESLEVNGRMLIGNTTAPGTTTSRMYAVGGNIFWNGTQLDVGTLNGWVDDGAVVRLNNSADFVGIGTTLVAQGVSIMTGNVGIGTWNPMASLMIANGNVGISTTSIAGRLSMRESGDAPLIKGVVTDAIATDQALINIEGGVLNTATDVVITQINTTTANGVNIVTDKIERGTNDAKIAYDEGTDRWQMDTGTGAGLLDVPLILDRLTAVNDVVNVNTESTFYSFNVPGNTLGTNRSLELVLTGDFMNDTGANRTLNIKVKYGATTMYDDTTGNLGTSGPRRGFQMVLYLANQGATGTQWLGGHVLMGDPGATTAGTGDLGGGAPILGQAIGGAAAIDSTAAQTFAVTVTHSATSPSLSVRRQYGILKLE